ncbi:methyltransferase domain-containing protein [Nonomuraea sp. NPDC049758]|uniref:methyltransferase domain-containing protein n=1 Tax=Nonomuraea sp. NPDC049758 TaxID=3154360 RepID=UPI0034358DA5
MALDLGCGTSTGTGTIYLATHGWDVTAIDMVAKALATARRNATAAGVTPCFIHGDVIRLHELGTGDGYTLLVDFGCLRNLPEGLAEHFRLRQRARALCESFTVAPEPRPQQDLNPIIEDFVTWLRDRDGRRPEREDIATLADTWSHLSGPGYYACSPYRIEHAVILVADGYVEKYAEAVLDPLPQWVEWCIECTGLTGELAERARQAAANNRWDGSDGMDLRRTE